MKVDGVKLIICYINVSRHTEILFIMGSETTSTFFKLIGKAENKS